MATYYDILGVSRYAGKEEIKQAFKKLALKYHPDKNPGNKQSEELFKRINEAHRVLSDQAKKQEYDRRTFDSIPPYVAPNQATEPDFSSMHRRADYYYTGTPGNTADFKKEGQFYQERPNPPKERMTDYYIIGITLFIIICIGGVLFNLFMNRLAARQHLEDATTFYREGQYKMAFREVGESIGFDDALWDAYWLRARLRYHYNNEAGALEDLEKALLYSDSTRPEIYYLQARCFYSIGNPQKALIALDTVIKYRPLSDSAWYLRGQIMLFEIGNKRMALNYFSSTLSINPLHTSALFGRALALQQLDMPEQSIKDLNQLLTILPHEGAAYFYRARAEEAMGNQEKAKSDFELARQNGYWNEY